MMDQYNMDQYNKETSQIHAPADLIRRTKEAVRQEEQRIAGERVQQVTAVKPRHSYAKVYKWALPVAAAAVCVILLNVSGLMFGRSMTGAGTGSAMDMTAGIANNAGMMSGAAQSNDADMMSDAAESVEAEMQYEDIDMAESVADATEEESVDKGSSISGMRTEVTAEAADGGYENANSAGEAAADSYIDSIYGSGLWIEEADETPSFYGASGTERITIDGVVLYAAWDLDDTWIAYVEIDGQKYVVRGELTEKDITCEEFAAEAYKLLENTVK